MTPIPHGQAPEALIDLIDTYAETRHRYGRIHNAKTEAARNAVIEALSGMQALSAAPADIAKLRHLYANLKNGGVRDTAQAKRIADGLLAPIIERLEQAAPKTAPGVGNSGFDHQTAADFLSGKTVSDEAVRKFVAASRWAHDERAALSATLLAMHGVLTSREAEIALLKKALLEAEAAPQQESTASNESAYQRGYMDGMAKGRRDAETAPQQEVQEPAVDDPTRWLTVVYRDISPGDEARLLAEHPKASAMSWSHAIRDRDAARAVLAKWGTPPAVAGEPVAWLSTDCIGERYLCFTKPKDSNPARPLVFGDTTPQPAQAQAGAVPQGWKAVPVNPTPEMWQAAKSVPDPNPPYPPHYGLVWDAMLAASPTPPAEQQAAPKAAPGELHDHQILAITTAYEQGVGKGRQAHESGKEIANPYDTGYRCDLAWQYGYEEGKKQTERIAEAAPKQEAQEPVTWESTTPGYIKYITQARYEKFSPAVRRWYKPYSCSGCAERGAGFDACDMATAAAQGFRDGQSTTKQEE